MMRQTLSSAMPDNEAAPIGARDQRLPERKPDSGEPSVTDAFKAIERIESRLSQITPGAASTAPAGIEDTLRGFETRISTLTERLSTGVRPIGRRGVSHEDELKAAVAQIRHRQADLDQGEARPPAAKPAPVSDRSHGDILLSLRGDMARLSGQIETAREPERQAIDHLSREFAALRSSLGAIATRADIGQIEQSVVALSTEVAQARLSGSGLAEAGAQFATLQAAIARLTEMQEARDDGRISREIERLSAKLDGTGAAEPALRAALAGQLHEIRAMVAEAAAPTQIATLSHHISSLRDEMAALGARQVEAQDFAALRTSVEDVRRFVSSDAGPRTAGSGADLASGLKPVEVLLHALVDKLDNVERQVGARSAADPDSLDSLERQIANLASRLTETGGRDPSIAHLERAMSGLVSEISTWREDALATADRAARSVVAETLATGAAVAADPGLGRDIADLKLRCEATEKRTEDSLAAVNRTLEDVAARIASLGGESARRGAEPQAPASALAVQAADTAAPSEPSLAEGAALKRLTEALAADHNRQEPRLGEIDTIKPPSADEILLEPGSARPPVSAGGKTRSDVTVDAADIKTSFIAAARRAAQAAATDAAATRGRVPVTREAAVSDADAAPSDLVGRLRSMVDKRRRPLLLSAAAIVLAIGTFQIARDNVDGAAPPLATAQLSSGLPADLADANRAAQDPVMTGSISPAPAQASAEQASASPAKPDLSIVPAQTAAAAPTTAAVPTPPAKPAAAPVASSQAALASPTVSADVAITPAGLKQAAQAGNPIAAYEFGARAAEGRGQPRDPQLAARFFEKAAEKGLAPAQYRTGNLYEKGIGVPRDIEAAKTWYRRAADNGNTRAMHNLAVLLAEGAGGKPDYPAAIGWFERAAAQGMRDSQFNLAVLLARGLGTAQNLAQSYTWFAVAAAGGDEDAAKKRDEVGARLSTTELARAKMASEQWRLTPPVATANEVQLPANGFAESAPATPAVSTTTAAAKKPIRDGRV